MRFIKACGKYQKKYSARRRAAAACLLGLLPACGGQASAQAGQAPQEQARESDLRAFCPPAEFADGAYAYKIYGKGGGLSYQAVISDITRDCRFDHDKGLIHLHIAAAGRAVPGQEAGRGALALPIEIKIARGGKVLFAETYRQKLAVSRVPAQFLLSEWVSVKKAEAVKGTKIFIGFAGGAERPARTKPAAAAKAAAGGAKQAADGAKQKAPPKPFAHRLSPDAGALTIPESF